jgi:hypothetical protein
MPVRSLLLATLAAFAAYGQSVVSVRSGLINFAEGEVFLASLPVEQKAGKFPELREGVELRTEAGRAEVLLTPGIVLRVGPDSAINMVSGSLIDTRVEFRRGSAVIEVSEEPDGTMARIIYRNYEMRFPKRGMFRIDSMPREFRVYDGEAEVSYLGEKCTLTKDHKVSLYGGLEAETLRRSITDGLDEWSMRRDNQLAADNPPPGDLNGTLDPAFAVSSNGFYGLAPYSAPVSPYDYGPGYYPTYPTFSTYGYGSYGAYGLSPYPIIIYGGYGGRYGYQPGHPGGYYPPVRLPIRPPAVAFPRGGLPGGISRPMPSPSHPITPMRPAVGHVGHAK